MKRKFLLNTATSLAGQLVGMICGFILPRLILEQFGSEVNGLTQSIKHFLGIISFLDLGVGQVIRSALYGPLNRGNDDEISSVLDSGKLFYRRLAWMLAGYVGVLTLIYPVVVQTGFGWGYTAALIAAMAVSTFAQYYFGIVNEQLIHADQRSYLVYGMQIGTLILNTLVCAWLIRAGCSIQTVKLATSAIFLLRPVMLALYIRSRYKIDRRICYTGEPIAQKWNGVAQHISAVILDGTDTIVLTLFSTLTNVSVYSVYFLVIGSLQQFYQSATAGIHSVAGALWAKGDRAGQERLFQLAQIALHYITVFLYSCTGLLIVPFVRVYTDGLTDGNYVQPLFAVLLTAAYGIRCLRTPYNIWILAAGHYRQTQVCHITAAALNLIISVLAVWKFGLVGVAVGTLCAMLYQTGWMAWYNMRALLCQRVWTIVKPFAVDILTTAAICLLVGPVELTEVSWLGWLLAAVKTALAAVLACGISMAVFYRRDLACIMKTQSNRNVTE